MSSFVVICRQNAPNPLNSLIEKSRHMSSFRPPDVVKCRHLSSNVVIRVVIFRRRRSPAVEASSSGPAPMWASRGVASIGRGAGRRQSAEPGGDYGHEPRRAQGSGAIGRARADSRRAAAEQPPVR
jgi:hypothetical protein